MAKAVKVQGLPDQFLDFRNFLWLVWKFLQLPSPTAYQYDIADALQNIVKPLLGLPVDPDFHLNHPNLVDDEGRPNSRLILEALRGVGKSWITGTLVVWMLAIKPTLNIMVVSASQKKASGFSTFCKALIEGMPQVAHLRPDTHSNARWSNIAFDVRGARRADQDASCYSATIMGSMTGGRGDVIICDDVEVPNTSETLGARERLDERVREVEAIVKPGGIIIFLGTPQTEDTIYKKLEASNHARAVWPARMPSTLWEKYHGHALSRKVREWVDANPHLRTGYGPSKESGAPADPARFSDEDLIQREHRYGRTGFALQFMLDTSLSDRDRYPLKLKDLVVMEFSADVAPGKPVWTTTNANKNTTLPCVGFRGDGWYTAQDSIGDPVPYQGIVLAIDPAGRGSDELAWCVVGQAYGYMYIMDVGGLMGDGYSEENMAFLANKAKQWNVNAAVIESNFGDGMFTQLLTPYMRKIHPCTMEEVRHNKQKERRIIDTLEPLMNQHRIVVSSHVVWADCKPHMDDSEEVRVCRQLFHQMTRITSDRGCLKHDDRLDALALACAYWVEAAALDGEEEVKKDSLRKLFERQKTVLEKRARVISTQFDKPKRERRPGGRGRLDSNWLK